MPLFEALGFNAFTEGLQRRFARFVLQKSLGQVRTQEQRGNEKVERERRQ